MANLSFRNNSMKPIYLLTNFDVNLHPIIRDSTDKIVKVNMVTVATIRKNFAVVFHHKLSSYHLKKPLNIQPVSFGLIGLIFRMANTKPV